MCNNKINYVALGDCITQGFLSFFLDGFAYRFCRFLNCNNDCVGCRNLGCSGLTSHGLLKQLKYDSDIRCSVKNADILTVTIGGNNLLKSTSNNYNCINEKLARKGVESFREDWPEILYNIREEIYSNAEIFVMNLYNPYCPSDPNYEKADFFINGLNSVIEEREFINTYDYNVVDVYSKFEENKDMEWTFFNHMFLRDPHPNWQGNQEIFLAFTDAYYEKYAK